MSNDAVTPQQIEHARQQRDLVDAYMPEMRPIIKEFVGLGMIRGWRDVRVTLNGPSPSLPAIAAADPAESR